MPTKYRSLLLNFSSFLPPLNPDLLVKHPADAIVPDHNFYVQYKKQINSHLLNVEPILETSSRRQECPFSY